MGNGAEEGRRVGGRDGGREGEREKRRTEKDEVMEAPKAGRRGRRLETVGGGK